MGRRNSRLTSVCLLPSGCFLPSITSVAREKQPDMPHVPADCHWRPLLLMGSQCKSGQENKTNMPLCTCCHWGSPGVATQAERRSSLATMHLWPLGKPQCSLMDMDKPSPDPTAPWELGFRETQVPGPFPYTTEGQPMWEALGIPKLACW